MPLNLDQLLIERARRPSRQPLAVLYSLIFHSLVIAAVWLVPELLAKPPEPIDYFSVIVVPPQALGAEERPEPPPPKVEPPTPEVEPPTPKVEPPPEPAPKEPPQVEPEPIPEDVPVLVEKKKVEPKKVEKKVEKKQPEPPPKPIEPPPKRVGSPFGSSLGASTQQATLGVEDPNFTYGYYLDRVVAVISSNWVRPLMGNLEARLHFRIQRDGTITELRLTASSTSREFDDAALRAVNTSSPLPPLPKGYTQDDLGINLIVK